MVLLWGVLWLVSRPAATSVLAMVQEGALAWITYICLALAALCLLTSPMMPIRGVLDSIRRIPMVGEQTKTFTIPAHAENHLVEIKFQSDELASYSIQSDQNLFIAQEPGKALSETLIDVPGGPEPYTWIARKSPRGRMFEGVVTELYITNEGDSDAKVRFQVKTEVAIPQVYGLTITSISTLGIYLIYFVFRWLFPRLSTIAVATAREAIAQPLYLVLMAVGIIALVVFVIIPYHTLGEDVKMYKDVGVTMIMVLAILVALWTASISIADEIEGRTALTLLSKPIGRRQFVLGKFAGIAWAVLLMFVILGLCLLMAISWKVIYDARETAKMAPEWQECYAAMISTVPGLVLAFLEAVVMASISVAISTRLPMLPNLVICGSIYVLGHLGPPIVQSSTGEIEFVAFFGRLIATILPVLDHFNIQPAITSGNTIPMDYLGWATLYGVLYCTAAMLFALFLFQDRDLA
ncbi:MAG: ABC transporter permease subunit [Pirellulales bacterium]|nr:ABC transporter permease subunit [Pirellulales bacterium]